jgi:sigma-B regulation protein RsbU (phosphoserine phosphatase)
MMPAVPYDQLRSALALCLPYVAIAALCLAAGLGAFALSLLRSRDRLLLWVGVCATLYSLRLFAQAIWENDLIWNAFGVPSLRGPIDLVTYVIPIPLMLFFRELLGSGWKSSIQIWLWIQVAYVPFAILAGSVAGYSHAVGLVNRILTIGMIALLLAHLFARNADSVSLALRYCFLVFLLFVLANNLGFWPAGRNPEPFGALVLIGGLAYTAAERAISREQKLAAVENELATARRIQTSILPRALPELTGLSLAVSYRPMRQVAGDFYDFLLLDERRVTVLIADVSGHGVPAALIASMLKVAFAQQALHAADPASVLAGLNSILHGMLDAQFITAACAHIDLAAHAITYAGAGHPPAILVRRSSGDILELAENGFILGPFRNASYTNICTPFHRGDRLLLYTDGIVEATFIDGEPFGPERLREFFAAQGDSEPAGLADALMNTVSIREQEDDLTVVVAEAS